MSGPDMAWLDAVLVVGTFLLLLGLILIFSGVV